MLSHVIERNLERADSEKEKLKARAKRGTLRNTKTKEDTTDQRNTDESRGARPKAGKIDRAADRIFDWPKARARTRTEPERELSLSSLSSLSNR